MFTSTKQFSPSFTSHFMKKTIYATIFFLVLNTITYAQSGTLDESFGSSGKVLNETFTGNCTAVVLQKDGKIVTGGVHYDNNVSKSGFVIARFNMDGSLDEGFGNLGRTYITNVNGKPVSGIVALAIQEDDKIIALGSFNNSFDIGVVRLKTDGRPDSTFSGDGILTIDIDGEDYPGDMVVQPDGKILITGTKGNAEDEEHRGFVTRILPNGETDESFAVNGIFITASSLGIYQINAIALQEDSKILIGGTYLSESLFIIRFLNNGRIDSTFDEDKDGITGIRFEDEDVRYAGLNDIALQKDGKIVAGGTAGYDNYKIAIVRFNGDGSIDSAFGDKVGYSVLPMDAGYSIARTVTVEADKKIVLTGLYYNNQPNSGFGAVKYNVDGSLDASFGENGVAFTGVNDLDLDTEIGAGVLQTDGKIIVGGGAYSVNNQNFTNIALVRYNNEIMPVPPAFAKIKKWQGHYGFTWNDWPGNKTTYYSVGRSTNASTFTEIAQVTDVKGITSYKYQDPAPPAGIVYYQLTAYRTDDNVVSSNIVTCGDDVPNNFIKLYPNPAKNSLHIEGLSKTEKTKLIIIDLTGNIIVAAATTTGSHTLNIATLKPGNYMLRIETNGNIETRMFVKE